MDSEPLEIYLVKIQMCFKIFNYTDDIPHASTVECSIRLFDSDDVNFN